MMTTHPVPFFHSATAYRRAHRVKKRQPYLLAARLPEYDHSCDYHATDPKVHSEPCLERVLGRPDAGFGEASITQIENESIARGLPQKDEMKCACA